MKLLIVLFASVLGSVAPANAKEAPLKSVTLQKGLQFKTSFSSREYAKAKGVETELDKLPASSFINFDGQGSETKCYLNLSATRSQLKAAFVSENVVLDQRYLSTGAAPEFIETWSLPADLNLTIVSQKIETLATDVNCRYSPDSEPDFHDGVLIACDKAYVASRRLELLDKTGVNWRLNCYSAPSSSPQSLMSIDDGFLKSQGVIVTK